MEAKRVLQDSSAIVEGKRKGTTMDGTMKSFLPRHWRTLCIAAIAFGLGTLAVSTVNMVRSPMHTRLNVVMTNQNVPSNTWINAPIESANGFKTLVAQFTWSGGFQMRNADNYAVTWYNDAAGKQEVGVTQFGQGIIPYQNQVMQVIAPYFQVQVKNTDSVAHSVNAWAYLMTN